MLMYVLNIFLFCLSDCASGIYCKNGGLCIENESDYSCDCSVIVGWKGRNCDHVGTVYKLVITHLKT